MAVYFVKSDMSHGNVITGAEVSLLVGGYRSAGSTVPETRILCYQCILLVYEIPA